MTAPYVPNITPEMLKAALAAYEGPYWGKADDPRRNWKAYDIIKFAAHRHLQAITGEDA